MKAFEVGPLRGAVKAGEQALLLYSKVEVGNLVAVLNTMIVIGGNNLPR